jgi:hypothetical protein
MSLAAQIARMLACCLDELPRLAMKCLDPAQLVFALDLDRQPSVRDGGLA